MHLLGLQDFVSESVMANKFVYVSSLDMDEALDEVPHRLLMENLLNTRV